MLLRLVVLAAVLAGVADAQELPAGNRSSLHVLYEDQQVRVHGVEIDPQQSVELPRHQDALLVSFTADLNGQRPPEEVSWLEAGTLSLENRGTGIFRGLLVELIAPRSSRAASMPPEATIAYTTSSSMREAWLFMPYVTEPPRVRSILSNDRVLVTAHRLPDWQPRTEPQHWHESEVVLVYLAGGDIAGSTGRAGPRHVRRGDFDVLPAGLLHAFQNVGNQPIEFVMISPR